jgi:hypothetical protein
MNEFEERLRAGLRCAAGDVEMRSQLDQMVETRMAQRRTRTNVLVAGGAVMSLVLVVALGVVGARVIHNNSSSSLGTGNDSSTTTTPLDPAQSNAAAQSNLQTALTAARTYYADNNQSFTGLTDQASSTVSPIQQIDTGLSFLSGGSSSAPGQISTSVLTGGSVVVLAAWAPVANNCWGILDLATVQIPPIEGFEQPGLYYFLIAGAQDCNAARLFSYNVTGFSENGFPPVLPAPSTTVPSSDDTAAQSDLQTALTGAKVYYTNSNQTYTGLTNSASMTTSSIQEIDTGLSYLSGGESTAPSQISTAVSGDGTVVVLTALAAATGNCWGIIDVTSNQSSVIDQIPGSDGAGTIFFVITGQAPPSTSTSTTIVSGNTVPDTTIPAAPSCNAEAVLSGAMTAAASSTSGFPSPYAASPTTTIIVPAPSTSIPGPTSVGTSTSVARTTTTTAKG